MSTKLDEKIAIMIEQTQKIQDTEIVSIKEVIANSALVLSRLGIAINELVSNEVENG